jgi:hypothetical protein
VHIWHKAPKKTLGTENPTAAFFIAFSQQKIKQQSYQPMMIKFLAFEPLEMADLLSNIIAVACL